MSKAQANGITLEFDTFGDPSLPAVLLIMGLGAQMTTWDPKFCEAIADRGFYVIRFDNRDIGLSTWFDDVGVPGLGELLSGTVNAPYSLSDMANDAAALLDELGIASAHIVGASMGGIIPQTFVIDHPSKTRTLTSIMSTTGDLSVGQPSPEALAALVGTVPTNRDEAIENGVRISKVIGSPAYPETTRYCVRFSAASYDRAFHPAGFVRQLAAVVTQPDRTSNLHAIVSPTLVIHGVEDPLVHPSGGEATANAINGEA